MKKPKLKERDKIPVEVDAKTTIYIAPGRNPKKAIKKFLERTEESKQKTFRQLKVGVNTQPFYTPGRPPTKNR